MLIFLFSSRLVKFSQATTVTRPSSYVISSKDVKQSYDFTDTWQDCATYCSQSYGFICNSFDFCKAPFMSGCKLYADRRSDIQTYLKTHTSPCFNYTVYQSKKFNLIKQYGFHLFSASNHTLFFI